MAEPRLLALGWLGMAALAAPARCPADAATGGTASAIAALFSGASDFLDDRTARIGPLLKERRRLTLLEKPDWLREQSSAGVDPGAAPAPDTLQLVVQQERRDGTALLTLRCPLAASGGFSTYAGAGLNQAVYYVDTREAGPALLFHSNRRQSTGAAAELGTELRVSRQVMLSADVRWAELGPQASWLRTDAGRNGTSSSTSRSCAMSTPSGTCSSGLRPWPTYTVTESSAWP